MEGELAYWKADGGWRCARPKEARFAHQKEDWWKHSGLRGFGTTKEEALEDLMAWEWAAEILRSIY